MITRDKLKPFVINGNITIIEALHKIDQNKKGFLIVVDKEGVVLGTLTDGDIRRAFIRGASVDKSIDDIYTKTLNIYLNRMAFPKQ